MSEGGNIHMRPRDLLAPFGATRGRWRIENTSRKGEGEEEEEEGSPTAQRRRETGGKEHKKARRNLGLLALLQLVQVPKVQPSLHVETRRARVPVHLAARRQKERKKER